ncbi:MAG: response regulator transcription factor [Gammaproteobacteria bacterium]|nr:response regulator transcription factor [Gammaproteobacteria bacterium]
MNRRVLLVEDDDTLRTQVEELLRQKLYKVDATDNGQEGLYLGEKYIFDIAIIDLGLPKMNGMEVITRLRQAGKEFPILVLTARADWKDKVEGLAAGADDYLVKPFHVQELLARMQALMRRASGKFKTEIRFDYLCMDTRSRQVRVDDQPIELTAYEYKLLEYMMMRPGQVVSKAELTEHIYEQDFDRDSNVIEVFIGRLRKKIDPDGRYLPIDTVRGQGYRLSV